MNYVKTCLIFAVIFCLQIRSDICAVNLIDEQAINPPADITFLIVDLKYNGKQGVKICEIQPGSSSVFMGYDLLHDGEGLVGEKLCDSLACYQKPIWFVGNVCDTKCRNCFVRHGWSFMKNIKELMNDATYNDTASVPVLDPGNIFSYHGLLFTTRLNSLQEFRKQYPGILILDAAVMPYKDDKYAMSQLLDSDERLKKLKPTWKLYPKEYNNNLITTILEDFSGDYLVIKPRKSTKGFGVIIVHKNELKTTLEYIFKFSPKLYLDPDLSYQYWASDTSNNFIVEEFVQSDLVSAPQFDNRLFDGTMRVVFILTYNQGKIDLTFLESHWKLPEKSISESGTFSELHKSYAEGLHFATVDPLIMQEVEEQLCKGLPILYQQMLRKTPVEY